MGDFTFNTDDAASLLSALSNSRRFQIVILLKEGELEVNAIANWVGLSQSAVSQHLRKLREAKVVKTRRQAQHIFYSLGTAGAELIVKAITELASMRVENGSHEQAA
jgi:DNA-binding transcriptional ArsR family regulator